MWVNKWTKGIRIVISMSKIRKIRLIIKKWILKGMWLDAIGSNPHSNGEAFSREVWSFLEMIKLISNKTKARVKAVRIINIIMIIIYIK